MFELTTFLFFLLAACVIAVSPGPGIIYVAARTLSGGPWVGVASSFGTGLGGLVHVAAGAFGVSALVMASAEAFTILKLVGAVYLVWLGVKTFREARHPLHLGETKTTKPHLAFREGVIVEALNPKTAAFFLAFIPQFVHPAQGEVALQFVVLGLVSVTLNTLADLVVVYMAGSIRKGLHRRPTLIKRMREGSAAVLCALGVSLAFARRPV
jgi:threonine/homoserine/homoserine lactone efflux protein